MIRNLIKEKRKILDKLKLKNKKKMIIFIFHDNYNIIALFNNLDINTKG